MTLKTHKLKPSSPKPIFVERKNSKSTSQSPKKDRKSVIRACKGGWSPADDWSVNADPGEDLLWLLGRDHPHYNPHLNPHDPQNTGEDLLWLLGRRSSSLSPSIMIVIVKINNTATGPPILILAKIFSGFLEGNLSYHDPHFHLPSSKSPILRLHFS